MVYFVCEGCNETLKKNKVDLHLSRNRSRCSAVTCVDCSQTFYGQEHAAHTFCITEQEKYEGALYKPKNKKNKKLTVQERWVLAIAQSGPEDFPEKSTLSNLVCKVKSYDNVPRKKAKFVNFMKNSLREFNQQNIESLYQHFEQKMQAEHEGDKATEHQRESELTENCRGIGKSGKREQRTGHNNGIVTAEVANDADEDEGGSASAQHRKGSKGEDRKEKTEILRKSKKKAKNEEEEKKEKKAKKAKKEEKEKKEQVKAEKKAKKEKKDKREKRKEEKEKKKKTGKSRVLQEQQQDDGQADQRAQGTKKDSKSKRKREEVSALAAEPEPELDTAKDRKRAKERKLKKKQKKSQHLS